MTNELQLQIARSLLDTKLVTRVYHSAQLVRNPDDQKLYPAYQNGADFVYLGPDDTKGMFAYIRTNGDAISTPLKIGYCSASNNINAPLRVVVFHDNEERNHQALITQLARFTFLQNVTLQRVIDDKFRLVKDESDLYRESFDAKTFYVAFDVSVNVLLLQSACEVDPPCEALTNPLCQ